MLCYVMLCYVMLCYVVSGLPVSEWCARQNLSFIITAIQRLLSFIFFLFKLPENRPSKIIDSWNAMT